MSDFMELYDLKNLFRVLTCYKNLEKPSFIDLFHAFESEFSDFHKQVVTILEK